MKTLNYTLIADGSSDKALLNIIKWSLDDLFSSLPNSGTFADFRSFPNPPKNLRAIKKAAGNRNYSKFIDLPPIKRLETENQPKEKLYNILRDVSGLKGRNLKKFNTEAAVHLLAAFIEDFNPLRNLEAFRVFEAELKMAVENFLEN